jgi:hypothetical protein
LSDFAGIVHDNSAQRAQGDSATMVDNAYPKFGLQSA